MFQICQISMGTNFLAGSLLKFLLWIEFQSPSCGFLHFAGMPQCCMAAHEYSQLRRREAVVNEQRFSLQS